MWENCYGLLVYCLYFYLLSAIERKVIVFELMLPEDICEWA